MQPRRSSKLRECTSPSSTADSFGTINLKPLHPLRCKDFVRRMEVNYLGAIKILQNYLPQLRNTKKTRNSLIRVCTGKDRIFRLETTQILILGFSKRPHL